MQYLFPTSVLSDVDWNEPKEMCHLEFPADILRAARMGQDNCFVSVKIFKSGGFSEITVLREAYMKPADGKNGRYTPVYFRLKVWTLGFFLFPDS
jgi:hypothetical protein